MKIAVCDDEKIFREMIIECLREVEIPGEALQILEFSSGEEVLNSYEKGKKYDLLFLDVEMEGISGIETGNRIREFDSNALIIFVTSYNDYVPGAFRVNAFQFLVKPVKQEDIQKELERAVERIRKNKDLYFIGNREGCGVVEIKDILYVDILLRCVSVHTVHGIYEKTGRLKEEIRILEPYDFVQYSKSGIVNKKNVVGIKGDELILKTGERIRMSKNYRADVRKEVTKFLHKGCSV